MVFESSVAPKSRDDFMAWFKEMIEFFPAMSGPLASDDVDNPNITDHCIGKYVVYSAFAWPVAEEAYPKMRELAIKYDVGFFDVSADDGEILFPKQTGAATSNKPWWKFW